MIYKNDIPIINTGFITEGIETDALTVILKTDEPEYEIMKGGAMFYHYIERIPPLQQSKWWDEFRSSTI